VKRKYAKTQDKKIVENPKLWDFIEKHLFDDQSPEAISGRITKHEKSLPSISKNSILRFIDSVSGRRIRNHREKRKSRRNGRRQKAKAKLKDRKFIDKRPRSIEKRQIIGHAEADFIVSGKTGRGIILNVVDRKSRSSFLEKITNVSIKNVHKAFVKIKKRFPELKTITTDNDLLFALHEELEQLLDVKIYFCHPYHSWEKGTVENSNKYVRRDIPKGSDVSKYSHQFIRKIEHKLNRRFMRCLNHLTPAEVLKAYRKQKRRTSVVKKWKRHSFKLRGSRRYIRHIFILPLLHFF